MHMEPLARGTALFIFRMHIAKRYRDAHKSANIMMSSFTTARGRNRALEMQKLRKRGKRLSFMNSFTTFLHDLGFSLGILIFNLPTLS